MTRMPRSSGREGMQTMPCKRSGHQRRGAAGAAGTGVEIVAEGGMGRGAGTHDKACMPSLACCCSIQSLGPLTVHIFILRPL